jgi:hypothetical protein
VKSVDPASVPCQKQSFEAEGENAMTRHPVLLLLVMVLLVFGADRPLVAQPSTEFLEITIPLRVGLNPAVRPPIASYWCQTYAGSPDPVEVRWIIEPLSNHNDDWYETMDYIRNNPDAPNWFAWQPYSPPDIGTRWISPVVEYGFYLVAVQGIDDGGITDTDFSEDRNMRRVMVGSRATGPVLSVTGEHISEIITNRIDTPVTEIDLNGGTPVSFCWTADASDYGLIVVACRYDWDVVDPDDWDMPYTPFSGEEECSPEYVFDSGTHTFYIEVIDFDGFKSRVPIQVAYTLVPVENTTWGHVKALYKK